MPTVHPIEPQSSQRTWRGLRPQPKLSHGLNTDETGIKNEEFEQEQTEKTEENGDFLSSLLPPVGSSVLPFYLCSSVSIRG
jgi:hypothetical protein